MSLRTNRESLVMMSLLGEAAPPSIPSGIYRVSHDGRPLVLPGVGGITLNVRVGQGAFSVVGDHIEPAVSARASDERANVGFNVLACVGNAAIVATGEAKGERGVVTGKHGGIEHVLIDFERAVMEKMITGDKIAVHGFGVGLELVDAPEVKCFNVDPSFLDAWGVRVEDGVARVRVAKAVPAAIMGSGLGRDTVARGDYDIQAFDDEMAERYDLRGLRFGDLVAILDADNSYGRIYRTGSVTIGIVAHGASVTAGHGPGVTTLLTSRTGKIAYEIDAAANLATILHR